MVFAVADAWAQAGPCSLLTASEIGAVGAAGQGLNSSMPFADGTAKGGTMNLCQWGTATGGLMLSAAKMPAGLSHEAVMTALNQSWSELETKGWKEEKQQFGTVSCFLMTPPAGDKGAPKPTSCTVFTKGMVLSITTMGMMRVEMEKVKALIDSAVGRL
jgi:hypothetical protein